MFIKEVLRLYPPNASTERKTTEILEIDGIKFPAGTTFFLNIQGLHRNGSQWDKPDEFRPERFADESKLGHHHFKWLPFLTYDR